MDWFVLMKVVSYCIERGFLKAESGCLQELCKAGNSVWK